MQLNSWQRLTQRRHESVRHNTGREAGVHRAGAWWQDIKLNLKRDAGAGNVNICAYKIASLMHPQTGDGYL
jgi:hypothetical protein